MRAKLLGGDNLAFAMYLLRIGEGREKEYPEIGESMIEIPSHLKSKAKSISEFCYETFPGLKNKVGTGMANRQFDAEWVDWLMSRAVICPTNEDAEEVNTFLLNELPGQPWVYRSSDKVLCEEDQLKYPIEYLNSIQLSSMPPHLMVLKAGAPIMLMRNLDPKNGHVNGARYVIKSMTSRVILAQLATGDHKGKDLLIPRIYFEPKGSPFQMQRKQFPVKPCFAITSNKSQGQTLSQVGIYLKHDFFGHGQLYTAMGRVGSSKQLSIFKPKSIENSDYMRNVVYKEILS